MPMMGEASGNKRKGGATDKRKRRPARQSQHGKPSECRDKSYLAAMHRSDGVLGRVYEEEAGQLRETGGARGGAALVGECPAARSNLIGVECCASGRRK